VESLLGYIAEHAEVSDATGKVTAEPTWRKEAERAARGEPRSCPRQALPQRSKEMVSGKSFVPDELWDAFLSIRHPPIRPHKGGRPRLPERDVLGGIMLVLCTGIPWEDLPPELGCGSGMTCWRRLRELQHSGEWDAFRHTVECRFGTGYGIDWSRAARPVRPHTFPRGWNDSTLYQPLAGRSARSGTVRSPKRP
jgi:transposase